MERKTIRIDETLDKDIQRIADDQKKTYNQVAEDALKCYRDYIYLHGKATFFEQQTIEVVNSICRGLERNINARTYKLLSEACVQLGILNQVIAGNLEVTDRDLVAYRLRAVESLKNTQRLLRLEDEAGDGA